MATLSKKGITKETIIPSVTNNGSGLSTFSTRTINLEGTEARLLSEQISALNFRLRKSNHSYSSDFHVAGDPTLLIVLAGTLKVELRNGDSQTFSKGEMFIAEDYLDSNTVFDATTHGHRAKVIGGKEFSALHLKLDKRT